MKNDSGILRIVGKSRLAGTLALQKGEIEILVISKVYHSKQVAMQYGTVEGERTREPVSRRARIH